MKSNQDAIKATLTYTDHVPFDFMALEQDLARVFANVGIDFPHSEAVARVHATFVGEEMSLRIARDDINLVIWIEDGTGQDIATVETRLAACFHAVRHISTINELETIVWHHTGDSYTLEEFSHRVSNDVESMAPTAAPAPLPEVHEEPAPVETAEDMANTEVSAHVEPAHHRSIVFETAGLDVGLNHDRLDRELELCMKAREGTGEMDAAILKDIDVIGKEDVIEKEPQVRKIAPRIAASRPVPEGKTENLMFREALYPKGTPEFDPAEDMVIFGPTHASDVADKEDVPARFATYALNSVLLVTALPVGLGMATYNVMGGENFRLTAQMVALTGMFNGLAAGGYLSSLTTLF